MVFNRRFKKRRFFRRKHGRIFKRSFHRGSLRRRVARVAKGVKNLRRLIEYKYYETATGTTSLVNTAFSAILVLDPAAGTGVNQRVGRNVTCHRISFRGTFSFAVAGTPTNLLPMRFRMLLVMDRRCSTPGTNPALADIFDDASGGSNAWIDSFRNLQAYSHYKVLWDKVFWMNFWADGTPDFVYDYTKSIRLSVRKNFKMKVPCEFDGSANPTRNAMWLLFVSDRGTTNSYYPIIEGIYTRAIYSDS